MQKQLNKLDRIEIVDEDTSVFNIRFGKVPNSGKVVLEVKNVAKAYGEKRVLENIDFILDKGDRIAFVGQNGMGKTTMAKMIVNQLGSTSGDILYGANVQVCYYAQNQSELLNPKKTLLEVMEDAAPPDQRSNIRNILGGFLFSGDDVEKKVSVLSGGERARLAMACMVMKPGNLLVMDEPTNHLDILSKEILQKAILDYEGTLIIVSHDREFLEGITDKVYEFVDMGIKEYLGDINYFLGKKNFEDVRDIDTLKAKNAVKEEVKPAFDSEETKKIKRKIQYLERDIEAKEKNIAMMSQKLLDPDFYTTPAFAETNKKIKVEQEALDKLMEEWETLAEVVS